MCRIYKLQDEKNLSWCHTLILEYPDYHVAGGTLQTTIRNEALCKAQCGQTGWCVGVDFDFSTLTCWFHSTKTVCNSLLVLAGTNHYKYVDCRKPTVYLLLITWLYLVNNDNFRLNKFQFWLKFSMSWRTEQACDKVNMTSKYIGYLDEIGHLR